MSAMGSPSHPGTSGFWGLILEPGKRYSRMVDIPFHITAAVLDTISGGAGKDEIISVMLEVDGIEVIICNLSLNHGILQVQLNLKFDVGSKIAFYITGSTTNIHLSGNVLSSKTSSGGALKTAGKFTEKKRKLEMQNAISPKKAKNAEVVITDKNIMTTCGGIMKSFEADDDDEEEVTSDDMEEEDIEDEEEEEEEEEEDSEEESGLDEDSEEELDSDSKLCNKETSFVVSPKNSSKITSVTSKSVTEKMNKSSNTLQVTPKKEKAAPKKEKATPRKEKATPIKEKITLIKNEKATPIKGEGTPLIKKEADFKVQMLNGASPIKKHAENNNVTAPSKTPGKTPKAMKMGGLSFTDLVVGTGVEAKQGKNVSVYYEGRLASNKKMFDKCYSGKPFKFRLGSPDIIKGWSVAIAGMKVGGKRKFVCPPHLGYGKRGAPPAIPPNAGLEFVVELKAVG